MTDKRRFPEAYAVHKGNAAMKINWAHMIEEQGNKLFLDLAESNGVRSYDWDNKFVFLLSFNDVATIIYCLNNAGRQEEMLTMWDEKYKKYGTICEIYHDPNAGKENTRSNPKILTISLGKDRCKHTKTPTFRFTILYSGKSKSIYLNGYEITGLKLLLENSLVNIKRWTAEPSMNEQLKNIESKLPNSSEQ